jgi:phenylacetate-coenzyme A ligase PaaK-like adenylate-forming protein
MTPASELDCLRNELVGETVRRAWRESSFYRRLYDGLDLEVIRTVGDLHRLPVLTKEAVREAGTALLCSGTCAYLQNTSGSTGEPLLLFRSSEEARFIREFFTAVQSADPVPERKPLVLSLVIPHHGTATLVPANVFVLHAAVTDDELLEHALVLLRSRFELSGVQERPSVLAGSHSQLLALTAYVLENGFGPESFAIRHVSCTGQYLTRRWREVLAKAWGARVVDRYTLSEIFGGATSCPLCGGYHFDPHVVPEVVDRETGEAREAGPGDLLLTSLYPFVQLQPLIRYATGDIFEIVRSDCPAPSYRFLGRAGHCLFHPGHPGRLLLAGVDVAEALDPFPEVARTDAFEDTRVIRDRSAAGRLIAAGRVEQERKMLQIELLVETVVTPALFPDRERDLAAVIRDTLCRRSPALTRALSEGEVGLHVRFAPPGSLAPWVKKTAFWTVAV